VQRAFPAAKVLVILFFIATMFSSFQEDACAGSLTPAPEITGQTWFNAGTRDHLSLKGLLGRVVIIFFTTLEDAGFDANIDFLNQLAARYHDKGLEVIGVVASEGISGFTETDLFLRIEKMGIKFPVILDTDSIIRTRYGQEVWPAVYFVDRKGFIRNKYEGVMSFRDLNTLTKILLEEASRGGKS